MTGSPAPVASAPGCELRRSVALMFLLRETMDQGMGWEDAFVRLSRIDLIRDEDRDAVRRLCLDYARARECRSYAASR